MLNVGVWVGGMCVVWSLSSLHSAPSISWGHGDHLSLPEDWSCRIRTFRCEDLSCVALQALSLTCCHVMTNVLTWKCVCACVCVRAVPRGEDPQRGRGFGPNIGFCLEQRPNQAQRSSSRWTHPAGSIILCKQVHTHTYAHMHTHTFSVFQTCIHVLVFDRRCDLILEVCHPQIVKEFGPLFLSHAHFMVIIFFLNLFFISQICLDCVEGAVTVALIALELIVVILHNLRKNNVRSRYLWRLQISCYISLSAVFLLQGGLSLSPFWCQFKPGAPSGGSQAHQDTLCTQWCIVGRPRHTEDEWQWEIKGDNLDMLSVTVPSVYLLFSEFLWLSLLFCVSRVCS